MFLKIFRCCWCSEGAEGNMSGACKRYKTRTTTHFITVKQKTKAFKETKRKTTKWNKREKCKEGTRSKEK